jgi:hypothetical protein
MQDCPNLAGCGFIQKYGDTKSIAVKGFILLYCKGAKQDECERKKYKAKTGTKPSDDMLPNGSMMKGS